MKQAEQVILMLKNQAVHKPWKCGPCSVYHSGNVAAVTDYLITRLKKLVKGVPSYQYTPQKTSLAKDHQVQEHKFSIRQGQYETYLHCLTVDYSHRMLNTSSANMDKGSFFWKVSCSQTFPGFHLSNGIQIISITHITLNRSVLEHVKWEMDTTILKCKCHVLFYFMSYH